MVERWGGWGGVGYLDWGEARRYTAAMLNVDFLWCPPDSDFQQKNFGLASASGHCKWPFIAESVYR